MFFAFIAWHSLTGPMRPFGNWDMLAYVGAVLSYTEDINELRRRSLSEVKNYISEARYNDIISGSNFRKTVANDDQAFFDKLPAYQVKPLYVLLTRLVSKATGNIAMASVLISAMGFLLMGVSLYLLRPRDLYEPLWLILVLCVLYFGKPPCTLLPSVATPDSLGLGFMLISLWAYFREPESIYPIAFMCLAIMARPDSIITIISLFPLLVKSRFDRVLSNKWLAWAIAIPIITYLVCKTNFPGYGWMELIVYTLKGPFAYRSDVDTTQFMSIYFPAVYNDFLSLLNVPRFNLFLLASVAIFTLSKNDYSKLIVFAAIANVIARIVLFPDFDAGYQERFILFSYFLVLFAGFNSGSNPDLFGKKHRTIAS